MPIKRPGAAPAAPKIKRVSQATRDGEFATKESLQDHLVVVSLREFDPAHQGKYGATEKAVVDVIDLDDSDAQHDGVWLFGNLAKQIGSGLEEGETGVGRVVTGPTKNGTGQWWGFQFSDDDAEYEKAEQALPKF
jgi:hypothetical protein